MNIHMMIVIMFSSDHNRVLSIIRKYLQHINRVLKKNQDYMESVSHMDHTTIKLIGKAVTTCIQFSVCLCINS